MENIHLWVGISKDDGQLGIHLKHRHIWEKTKTGIYFLHTQAAEKLQP